MFAKLDFIQDDLVKTTKLHTRKSWLYSICSGSSLCEYQGDEHVYTYQHLSHVGMRLVSMFTFCCEFSLKVMNSIPIHMFTGLRINHIRTCSNNFTVDTCTNKFIFPLSIENKHGSCSSRGSSGSSSASASTQQQQPPGPASDNSNSNNKGNGTVHPYPPRLRHSTSLSSCSEFTSVSQQPRPNMEPDRISIHSGRVGPANGGNLGVAAHLANSRESFQQALDNPCEYFIDVM